MATSCSIACKSSTALHDLCLGVTSHIPSAVVLAP